MERFMLPHEMSEEQKKEAKELAEKLLADPNVQTVLTYNGIPAEQIVKTPFKVKRWLDAYTPCLKCAGLERCGQKEHGYFDNLVYDGYLHTEKKACKYERSRQEANSHMQYYLINEMPEKLNTVTFQSINAENEKAEYLGVMAEAMSTCMSGESLYLYGTMGSGKTYLAACAANYYARQGKKVAFIHYPTFIQKISSMVKTGEHMEMIRMLCYAKFVVFDDIGAENVTEWNRDSVLLPILNERYEKGLPTWFTSNEDLKSLEDHFRFSSKGKEEIIKAARIMERIQSMCKTKALTGEDRRKSL